MTYLSRFVISGVVFAGWMSSTAFAADDRPTPEQISFFEKSIRPVLVKECYSCHSANAEKIRGGFTLDTRDGLRKGGTKGAAIVPGDVKKSLLIKGIKHAQDDFKMPPKKKLDDTVIADFEKWIAMGAPDPRANGAKVTKNAIDIEKGRHFWAFQPVKKTNPPAVQDTAWPKGDIDRYILADLEAKHLRPVADADARTLIRRLYFDLTGLPPIPAEVEAFVKDYAANAQTALETVVDKLLASPQFGERWARHWMDVARYAESSGRANNFAYPHAWRYRDYVIAAFNADKPYDQFIREQLAGDLLPAKDDTQKTECLTATGFLAIGAKSHNERNPRQFQMDLADEQIDATFQAFQGLTVACARCHDHKFDPIPQKDYYALAGIFRSTDTNYGTIRVRQNNAPSSLVRLPNDGGAPMALPPLTAERRSRLEKEIKDQKDRLSKLTGQNAFMQGIFIRTQITTLESQLALYEADGTPKLLAMGVRDRYFGSDSRLYNRGELDQPGETVKRGFPQVLTTKQPTITDGSGRRELADWIASKDNPLTARVMANRVWMHLIGHGLVATPDNFGASGQKPSNPALLDHLAATFTDNSWSVKKLIRTIVLSRTYRLSGEFNEKNYDADPDNVLVWRMPKRRLEVEALRDTLLAVSGRLELSPPVGSSVARAGEGNIGFRLRGGFDTGSSDRHRAVYLPIIRDLVPEMFTIFDFPDPTLIIGERAATTIPAQSLFLMNNSFVIRQAEALADKLQTASEDNAAKVTLAYELCFSRPPSEKEMKSAQKFIEAYSQKQTRRAAWKVFCQALFTSAEFSQR